MTTGFRTSSGADLDSVFVAYSSGTKAGTTGFRTSAGQDMADRFQPYTSGQKASTTGYRNSAGTDLCNLFQYVNAGSTALPINGQSYSNSVFVPAASSGTVTFQFRLTSATTWDLFVQRTAGCSGGPPTGTQTSGSVPSGAATVRYTPTYLAAGGDTGPSTVTNSAASATALAANVNIGLQLGGTGTSSPKQSTYNIKVEFLNSSGTVISTTNFTAVMLAEGSA